VRAFIQVRTFIFLRRYKGAASGLRAQIMGDKKARLDLEPV